MQLCSPARRRRSYVALTGVLGLALMVAACGRDSAAAETPTQAASPTVAVAQPVTLPAAAQQPAATPNPESAPPPAPEGASMPTGDLVSQDALAFINETVDAQLAATLGISVETLQAAREEALAALPDRPSGPDGAGRPDQAQDGAARTPPGDGTPSAAPSGMPSGMPGGMPGGAGFGGDNSQVQTALAAALGISAEELVAATETAYTAALAQAVEQGYLSQAGADYLAAQRALQSYTSGLGETRSADYAALVQAALDAGAVTDAQATLLLENAPAGFPQGQPGPNAGGN